MQKRFQLTNALNMFCQNLEQSMTIFANSASDFNDDFRESLGDIEDAYDEAVAENCCEEPSDGGLPVPDGGSVTPDPH